MENGKIDRCPHIPRLSEKGNVRKGFLGDSEQAAVVAQWPLFAQRVLSETAYTFGWRENDLLPLEWTQIDFVTGVIHIDTGATKENDGREVVLTEELLEM